MQKLIGLFLAFWALAMPASAQQAEPLADAAAHYALFQDDVAWLTSAPIDAPGKLDEALDRAARHTPEDVARGWIAYEALVAAQSPAFVQGVQARVRAAGRAAVLRRLAVDPTYARKRPTGSSDAIQLVLQSSATDSARVGAAADRWLGLGDSLRAAPWAATAEADQTARLDRLQNLAPPAAPAEFVLRVARDPAATRLTLRPTRAALMDRILTLAALRIVNAPTPRVVNAAAEPGAASCLTLTRLEYRQCISVTQFGYENAFCLARHGLREPGACLDLLVQH